LLIRYSLLIYIQPSHFSYKLTNGDFDLSNFNSTQCETTNPVLQSKNVSTLLDEELNSGSIIMQLEKEFTETIESESKQHAQELLAFIDAEIEQLSGTGLV